MGFCMTTENKKAIFFEPGTRSIEEIAKMMGEIKDKTGKEVYVRFDGAKIRTYITTEMGNAQDIINWFYEAIKNNTPLTYVSYIPDESSKRISKMYREGLTEEQLKEKEDEKKLKERYLNVFICIVDLTNGEVKGYEDKYCKVSFQAINGNLEEMIIYKQYNPLHGKENGKFETKRGTEVAIDLLEYGGMASYKSRFSTKYRKNLQLSSEAREKLMSYMEDLNNRIEALAREELKRGMGLDIAIRNACISLRDNPSIPLLKDFEVAKPKEFILGERGIPKQESEINSGQVSEGNCVEVGEVFKDSTVQKPKSEGEITKSAENQKEQITEIARRQNYGAFRSFLDKIKNFIAKFITNEDRDK